MRFSFTEAMFGYGPVRMDPVGRWDNLPIFSHFACFVSFFLLVFRCIPSIIIACLADIKAIGSYAKFRQRWVHMLFPPTWLYYELYQVSCTLWHILVSNWRSNLKFETLTLKFRVSFNLIIVYRCLIHDSGIGLFCLAWFMRPIFEASLVWFLVLTGTDSFWNAGWLQQPLHILEEYTPGMFFMCFSFVCGTIFIEQGSKF